MDQIIPRISVSLVSYKDGIVELADIISSLCRNDIISAWVVVDNAAAEDSCAAEELRLYVEKLGGRYIATPKNLGFGAAHNLALRSMQEVSSEFHLMVNPDILFDDSVLPGLVSVLDARPQVGWVMPKVLYPNGSQQFLCKLLPTPLDFAVRRFVPVRLHSLIRGYLDRYELRGLENSESTTVPFLSGCFVMVRRAVLQAVGGFDERYFLYMEDVDLCRRMAAHCELLYWPDIFVTHGFRRGSHRSLKLMLTHLRSSIIYFNRWGWIFDRERRRANRAALAQLYSARSR
jgi:GT2 family glycosyltransferase